MDVIESLNLWMWAKTRIPPESHSDAAYFRNTWPKRLNTCALARLQSQDNPHTRSTWDMLISQATAKGTLPFEAEMFIDPDTSLPLERGGCQYEYHTVAPGDFARFLRSQNIQPSKLIEAWFFAYGVDPNPQDPEPEALAQQVMSLNKVSRQSCIKETKVDPFFSQFSNLRANEISVMIMENNTATISIKRNKITVSPSQLGLNVDSQGWKLLEGAAVNNGDLTESLKRLNKTSDLEAEKGKIKKAVHDLRKPLKNSMGLIDNPILYQKNNGYRFSFKFMTHELLNDGNISKGADAFTYATRDVKEDDKSYEQNFEEEYDDEQDSESDY